MVGAVSPRRARHLVTRALGSTSTKRTRATLGSTNQGTRGTRGRSTTTTEEGSLGAAEVGHAWGGAARVAVHEEQGLSRVSVNLLRKRRLRPVRDAAGLSQAVLEEVAVQVLGLGLGLGIGLGLGFKLGLGLDSRRMPCSFRGG